MMAFLSERLERILNLVEIENVRYLLEVKYIEVDAYVSRKMYVFACRNRFKVGVITSLKRKGALQVSPGALPGFDY